MVYDWNSTQRDYNWSIRAYDLIKEKASQVPNNLAMIYERDSITYSELVKRVDALAEVLVGLGIGPSIPFINTHYGSVCDFSPDVVCGVYSERCISLLVAMFAIFKTGGAYLPLEPDYPVPRLEFMLTDSKAHILITNKPILSEFLKNSPKKEELEAQLSGHIIYLDEALPQAKMPTTEFKSSTNPEDIFFTFYTESH